MLKKLHFLLLILVVLNISAQNNFEMKITNNLEYGIKFGLSASHLASDDGSFDVRAGFSTGLTAEYPFYKKLNLKLDFLYLRQGQSDRKKCTEEGIIENNLKLDYLSVPLLFSYPIVEKLSIESGLGMLFLLQAKQEIFNNNEQIISTNDEDFNDFDLNYSLGMYYTTSWNFVVGLRYSRGLIEVNQNEVF
jgi:hypothetical protein